MDAYIYVYHSASCSHKNNRFYRQCKCRKWIYVTGSRQRISAKTRSWAEAEKKLSKLKKQQEADGQSDRKANSVELDPETVREAVNKFLENKREEGLSKGWERKLTRELLDFAAWCETKLLLLSGLKLLTFEDYRKTWKGAAAGTRSKRQERLKSFCKYCVGHGWMKENFAANLSKIKVSDAPTLPLTREQFDTVLETAQRYNPKAPDSAWRRQRATAMLLLLRWSGLRISDAAKLERSKLTDKGALHLYTQKTGQPVYVPLPPHVVKMLRKIHNENPRYFFWNGTSDDDSPGKRWWSTLKKIFKAAKVPEAYPHMLRDTFAVEMLVAGVALDQVSILLGHSSVKITEKHYAPWVKARQQQLEDSVRKAWAAVPVGLIEQPAQSSVRVN